jgi:hypothetical protein
MRSKAAKLTMVILLWTLIGAVGWCGEDMPAGGSSAKDPVMLLPVEVDGKWGYMDQAGNVMIAPQLQGVERAIFINTPYQIGSFLEAAKSPPRVAEPQDNNWPTAVASSRFCGRARFRNLCGIRS